MSLPARLGFVSRQIIRFPASCSALGNVVVRQDAKQCHRFVQNGQVLKNQMPLRTPYRMFSSSELGSNDQADHEEKRKRKPKKKKTETNDKAEFSSGASATPMEGKETGGARKNKGKGPSRDSSSREQSGNQQRAGNGQSRNQGSARSNAQGNTGRNDRRGAKDDEKKGRRVANPRQDRMASKILQVDRVTQATSSRKIYKFRALVAVGDTKGIASFGTAKGPTFRAALHQAYFAAMKDRVPMDVVDPLGCIYHDVQGEFNNTIVKLYAARPGHGIVAGPIVRGICEVVGIKHVSSKVIGPRNPYSVTHAMFNALGNIESPFKLATRTGRRVILSEYTKDA